MQCLSCLFSVVLEIPLSYHSKYCLLYTRNDVVTYKFDVTVAMVPGLSLGAVKPVVLTLMAGLFLLDLCSCKCVCVWMCV